MEMLDTGTRTIERGSNIGGHTEEGSTAQRICPLKQDHGGESSCMREHPSVIVE